MSTGDAEKVAIGLLGIQFTDFKPVDLSGCLYPLTEKESLIPLQTVDAATGPEKPSGCNQDKEIFRFICQQGPAMISKAQIKFIKSLQIKKYRKQEQCFVVEGRKSVEELLRSDMEVVWVAGTRSYFADTVMSHKNAQLITVTQKELQTLGEFQSNDEVIAVARIPIPAPPQLPNQSLALVLDDIRDPGNLGTIIRTADWFGITTIFASPETADLYNPKVISATMGSFTRIRVHYTELVPLLKSGGCPVYGAFLTGEDIHTLTIQAPAFIAVGNESHGISDEVARLVSHRITIPRYGKAESLNAAIATAIVLDTVRASVAK
jgi:TrmH family RNA methyltransferase